MEYKILVEYKQNGRGEELDKSYSYGNAELPHSYLWDGDKTQQIPCCSDICHRCYPIGVYLATFADSPDLEASGYIFCELQGTRKRGAKRCANSLHYRFRKLTEAAAGDNGKRSVE